MAEGFEDTPMGLLCWVCCLIKGVSKHMCVHIHLSMLGHRGGKSMIKFTFFLEGEGP
jgi:hypothetical protein